MVLYERGFRLLVKLVLERKQSEMEGQGIHLQLSVGEAGDNPPLAIKKEREEDQMDVDEGGDKVDEAGDKEVAADDKVVEPETVVQLYTDENNKHELLCFFNKGLVNKF